MSEANLRAAIETIRAELPRTEGLNEGARESLRRLADDLEAVLRRSQPAPEPESLRRELGDWVRELEATHPTLSTSIGNVIDTLAFFNL